MSQQYRHQGLGSASTSVQIQQNPRAFDEPLGFRIQHIEVIPNQHSAELAFPSSRWKPPTQRDGVRLVDNVQYARYTQATKFILRPNQPLTPMGPSEELFFHPHKSATMFWAVDSGTFMHVPFDCTQRDVEDPDQADSDYQDDDGGSPTAQQPSPPRRTLETWRRLRFHHHYPGPDLGPISRAWYYGGSHEIGGRLPERWQSTLIPSVHRPNNPGPDDCQLAGELPLLLGLVAFCHPQNEKAIGAVATWFPPSNGTTFWAGPRQQNSMQFCDYRKRRGMIIETFYDSRRHDSQQTLQQWEEGLNGPIIT